MAEPITYAKNTVTETDPWGGADITFIKVTDVYVGDKFVHDTFSYPVGTTDQFIADDVKANLLAEGYDV